MVRYALFCAALVAVTWFGVRSSSVEPLAVSATLEGSVLVVENQSGKDWPEATIQINPFGQDPGRVLSVTLPAGVTRVPVGPDVTRVRILWDGRMWERRVR